MAEPISLTVDGSKRVVETDTSTPLLYVLRDQLGLSSPHFGCGLGQCGACTVQVNGEPVRSCITAVSEAAGKTVTTLAGLGTPDRPHPIQTAYIEEQTPQCGYCIAGWMLTAVALLKTNPHPSDADIRTAMADLKCRCGTHLSIIRAVKRAAVLTATAKV